MSSNEKLLNKARKNLQKIIDKFEKAGGTYLFYDTNSLKKTNDKRQTVERNCSC